MHTTERMSTHVLERPFAKMGARVKVRPAASRWRNDPTDFSTNLTLNVRRDEDGEYFSIDAGSKVQLQVLDVQPKDRHLLLLSRIPGKTPAQDIKSRFLLGHDERHWFVAAIPERSPVTKVVDAKQALKPDTVVEREANLKPKHRHLRSNDARVRQGEWFFVPVKDAQVNKLLILKNEPIRRGSGKPHMCEELYRYGGTAVHVNRANPNGISAAEFNRLSDKERNAGGWRIMTRDAKVLVRGKIRHSDHKTVILPGWHEVFVNTESFAVAMAKVAFLD